MSDWEDEPTLPQITTKRVVRQQYDDDDDEWNGPLSESVQPNSRHEKCRSSNRSFDHQRQSINNYMDCDGQEEQTLFTVNKSSVGIIIGRGGSKINEIQSKYGVRLNIDKETNRDGNVTVTIKGGMRESHEAKRFILDLVSSNRYESRGSNLRGYEQRNDNTRSFESRSNEQQHKDTLEIYPDKVGMVIGRRGTTINEVQDKFKVKVNIDKNTNYNGKATVTVSGGSRSDVANAIENINGLVGDSNACHGSHQQQTSWAHELQPDSGASWQKQDTNSTIQMETIDWQAAARESEIENKKRWASLPPLQKNFYEEHADVRNMTSEQVDAIRQQNNNITVSRLFLDENQSNDNNEPIPNPVTKFEHCFQKYPDLMEQIANQGFEKPSPIQSQAWPVLLKGEDLIGIAQTGTGKTLAFLLPAMIHTEYQSIPRSERNGPNVLVLAPTRELALQIEKEVAKYSFRGMKAVCVYGGGDRKAQINNIQTGVEIIIATPGRLNDLVEAKVIDVCTITFLILDEADRMLDMGFEPQIRKVLLNIRPDRVTVMTSATWPSGVRRLAQRYMSNPIQVCVGSLDLAAVHSVTQVIKIIDEDNKYREVMNFVKNQMDPEEKAIIFCGKKARADDLSSEFSMEGICCACIHGNRDQSDREQALLDIKDGVVKILIATDVASRGIDIQDLSYVINYDFPRNIEEYVHRVGRTGRAGRTGKSISYVTRSDWGSAGELINILEEAEQDVPDALREMKTRFDAMQERKERERESMGGGGRRFGGRFGSGGGGSGSFRH
ncbi:probable ATP-dependent RNA helicase DDX43 [Contarinia nasturtii]|uniref:probable ATP-dependent RNA helicase DDX43 n=1 Tax=Contarinia nasturtii TaxID=265458 RepID=UPI0012D3D398|nr:probable ATP-dependent RNA helicase DDX43 [Contarinia nasturtii]XP_031637745.1 probable ATP-dependent RNA helicase DDX43 [Contarinia nasturtii]